MDDPLAMYKAFIDGLVQRSTSAEGVRMKERILYEIPPVETQERDARRGYTEAVAAYRRFSEYNKLLAKLSDEERSIIADLLQREKEAGMAEVLAFLADGQYQLVPSGSVLPFEPFDTSYHYDFVA